MTIEFIIILVIAASLVGGLAYMVARSQGKQALSESEQDLSATNAEKSQLETLLTNTAEQKENLAEQVRQLELDKGKTQISLETLSDRKQELEKELEQTKNEKNQVIDQKHEAEKLKESMQAEVKERKHQEQDLQQRLQQTNEELKTERQALSQSKLNNSEISEKSKAFEVQAHEAKQQLAESKQTINLLEEKQGALQNRFDGLNREHAELVTSQVEREGSHAKQLAQFEEQKQALSKEFENLANKIFEQKGKAFSDASKNNINGMLQPFKDQIEGFQKRINEVHDASVRGNTNLNSEIKKVLDVGLRMSDEATSLATALKGDKKALGTWSEVQAELLLQMSGLREGHEYHREANYKTEDGSNQRPDFVINLPNGKHLIVDSKMSLNAYVEATAAETEEQRSIYIKAHVDAIRKHINDLSSKSYTKLKNINTPEFVFMFIGNEPAYLAALEAEPNLAQGAYKKGVAIVTSNTLLSSLRIVTHLWSIDKQNSNTKALAEQASKVYEKLRVFIVKMDKLGNQLNTVNKTYDDSCKTLKGGNGSLAKQVSTFVDMGVSVKEQLPAEATEGHDLDLALSSSTNIENNAALSEPDFSDGIAAP
ncbi:MAG: DNA recombination protein RmuC [Cycloclasticus sp.]|jgi:Uncharacterized protein conserved in bacteria